MTKLAGNFLVFCVGLQLLSNVLPQTIPAINSTDLGDKVDTTKSAIGKESVKILGNSEDKLVGKNGKPLGKSNKFITENIEKADKPEKFDKVLEKTADKTEKVRDDLKSESAVKHEDSVSGKHQMKTGLHSSLFESEHEALLIDVPNDSAEVSDELKDVSRNRFHLNPSKFEEFVLPDMESFNSNGNVDDISDRKNIYKVPKTVKTKKPMGKSLKNIEIIPKDSRLHSEPLIGHYGRNKTYAYKYYSNFQLFTNLYDHNFWSIEELSETVSKSCSSDLKIYLHDLRASKSWALKVSDSSGRYGGQYFFGNDFWMGSMQFCGEVNYEAALERKKFQLDRPTMQFFVARVLVKMDPIFPSPKLLQLGQCLPKSCSADEVIKILNADPAAVILQLAQVDKLFYLDGAEAQSQADAMEKINELNIVDSRKVPGDYDILMDQKFYIFGSILLLVTLLVTVASFYESALQRKGYSFEGRKMKQNVHTISNSKKTNNNSPDKYEMNQMNHADNNNGTAEEGLDKKVEQKDENDLSFLSKIVLCFAYGSNSKVLLSVEKANEDAVTCIHGLRLVSLLWTVMVHTYLQMFAVGENRFFRLITERSFGYQLVGNATFSVDTFFFISGLLIVLLFLRTEKKKKLNNEGKTHVPLSNGVFLFSSFRKSFFFVFYRFLRLTPAYFFIVVFTELSMKVTYDRSVFTPGLTDHINCNQYWWRNILYINNWYPFSQMCMIWSWYLANDMQLYVIAIILLILSTRFFKFSVISLCLVLLGSWTFAIFVSIHFNYVHKVSDPFESFDILYDKPWQRIGPYIMGMLAGYILHRVKKPPRVPFLVNLLLWLLSLFILFIIVFGVWNGQLSVFMTSFYVSLGHTAWGFALIWISLSCNWGLASPINSLLSYKGFYPLSRLTYCAYLIHPTVMMITSFQMEAPMHLQHVIVLTTFLGNAVISFIFAFFIAILFESPTVRLLKLFFSK